MIAGYGWRPDLPDFNDLFAVTAPAPAVPPPPAIDLRSLLPPAYNQLSLGSCVANAVAAAMQWERRRQQLEPDFVPSRLFLYWNARFREGTTAEDTGAQVRDGLWAAAKFGVCPEETWGYELGAVCTRPNAGAFAAARTDLAIRYERVPQNVENFRSHLAAGRLIVGGLTIYPAFESDSAAATGDIPMPEPEQSAIAGHAMAVCGYIDSIQRFILRNSWGPAWGDRGYALVPYAYLTTPLLARDFWTISLVSQPDRERTAAA